MGYKNKFYVGMVSTVPPRKCGIAKFNWDFYESIEKDPRIYDLGFYSIVKESMNYELKTKKMVEREIFQDNKFSWHVALEDILSKTKIRREKGIESGFVLQHEYGIWGKNHDSDDNIVKFLRVLRENRIPTVTVAHTLRLEPSYFKRKVMEGILENSTTVVCLTPSAVEKFQEVYGAQRERLVHIQHGVPKEEIPKSQNQLKKDYGLTDGEGVPRQVISNVGLLSPSKDIVCALKGFAEFLKTKPRGNPLFLVAGQTHPEVLKNAGESYRQECIKVAKEIGLRVRNSNGKIINFANYDVVFLNKYLSDLEYLTVMKMSDVGLVTNNDKNQVSSGQIAYWVGMERPTIVTESLYSKDMESEGVGLLIEHGNVEHVSDRLRTFFSQVPSPREELKQSTIVKGATMSWKTIGGIYVDLLSSLTRNSREREEESKTF